jgi:hypothetical protein
MMNMPKDERIHLTVVVRIQWREITPRHAVVAKKKF